MESEGLVATLQPDSEGDWIAMNFGIDSCAATSCIGANVLTDWPLYPHERETKYRSACGGTVKSLGTRTPYWWIHGFGPERSREGVSLRVLDPLSKPLLAVSHLTKFFDVHFDTEENGGSYLQERATGARTKIWETNNVYKVKVWLKKSPAVPRQSINKRQPQRV